MGTVAHRVDFIRVCAKIVTLPVTARNSIVTKIFVLNINTAIHHTDNDFRTAAGIIVPDSLHVQVNSTALVKVPLIACIGVIDGS